MEQFESTRLSIHRFWFQVSVSSEKVHFLLRKCQPIFRGWEKEKGHTFCNKLWLADFHILWKLFPSLHCIRNVGTSNVSRLHVASFVREDKKSEHTLLSEETATEFWNVGCFIHFWHCRKSISFHLENTEILQRSLGFHMWYLPGKISAKYLSYYSR